MLGVGGGNSNGFSVPFNALGGMLAVVMIVATIATNMKGCFEGRDVAEMQFVEMNKHLDSIDGHLARMDERQERIEVETLSVADKLKTSQDKR